jgi:hypothetical protein
MIKEQELYEFEIYELVDDTKIPVEDLIDYAIYRSYIGCLEEAKAYIQEHQKKNPEEKKSYGIVIVQKNKTTKKHDMIKYQP